MTLIVRFKGDLYEETPIVHTPSGPMVFHRDAWRNIITDEDLVRSIQRIEPLPRPVPLQPGLLARYCLHGSGRLSRELPVQAADFYLREYYVVYDGGGTQAENAVEPGEEYTGVAIATATKTDDEASR